MHLAMAAIITLDGQPSEEQGHGSFGSFRTGNVKVGLKKLHKDSDKDFDEEVKHLMRAQHENIIRLYGITITESGRYIVLEYAECGSLDKWIYDDNRKKGPIARQSLMLQCAKGVDYLHNLVPTILHRDLKPNNILLTNNYKTAKICDFGTVRERDSTMTQQCGTASYTAPEVTKSQKYSEKCDVYSFGIILYEVMSGQRPFAPNYDALTILNITSKGCRPTISAVKHCTNIELMQDLINQCWHADPNKRPPMRILCYFLGLDLSNIEPRPVIHQKDFIYKNLK